MTALPRYNGLVGYRRCLFADGPRRSGAPRRLCKGAMLVLDSCFNRVFPLAADVAVCRSLTGRLLITY